MNIGDLVRLVRTDFVHDEVWPGGYENYPGDYSYNRRHRVEMYHGLVLEQRGEYLKILVGGKLLWYPKNILERLTA